MATYTEVLATDIIKPNIDVYRQLKDEVCYAYHISAQTGYVLYDPTSDTPILDENMQETGEVIKTYCRDAYIPLRLDPSVWTWKAVKEREAKEYEENI